MNHGVYVSEQGTSVSTPVVADSGIPFVVGAAPVQSAENPASAGVPVLCTSWDEAVEKLGYSDDWDNFDLCEFMYSHFKLFGCAPVIFVNALDPSSDKEAVTAAAMDVEDHQVELPFEAIASSITAKNGQTSLVKGTDFDVVYEDGKCIVELISTSAAYSASSLTIGYDKVKPSLVTAAKVATAMEAVELCLTTVGIVPDLICAPKYSKTATVAAVMATKAAGINGMFPAKALIDIDTSSATSYSTALTIKTANGLTDKNMIVCWPMVKLDDMVFHLSTQLAGLMAKVDTDNGGIPYESPSNKGLKCTGLCLEGGAEVQLTHAQANILNGNGIVTALNFINGWTAWGNNTACYPGNTDVKDYHIPIARMFGFVAGTLIKTFWSKLDEPMTRRFIDSVLDSAQIWLNGLVSSEYLLGARVEMLEAENPTTNLMQGIIKLHIYMTPPSAAQEIDFVLEYDASYVEAAFA